MLGTIANVFRFFGFQSVPPTRRSLDTSAIIGSVQTHVTTKSWRMEEISPPSASSELPNYWSNLSASQLAGALNEAHDMCSKLVGLDVFLLRLNRVVIRGVL